LNRQANDAFYRSERPRDQARTQEREGNHKEEKENRREKREGREGNPKEENHSKDNCA